MENDLSKIIEHENAHWSKVFKDELENNNYKKFSSFWWEDYYKELSNYINNLVRKNSLSTVLEAGSGSGKATILLDPSLKKNFLDISPIALKFANFLAIKFGVENPIFIKGNIFEMPIENNSFDLVWNIGVIEHYDLKDIELILREMIRVSSESGIVALGMPNFHSGPILKARFLKKIKFMPGYKIDTEKFHDPQEIKKILEKISKEYGRKISYLEINYFGNPLLMETPRFILKTIGKFVANIFNKNKFLILITCKFEPYA
ncbi:MAG TPA: hypothetical protein DIT25_04605 [Candidatus Moranbacteria bacterium]|nr:hypothetical protein [Candidatus Moranbacteria bacterium]